MNKYFAEFKKLVMPSAKYIVLFFACFSVGGAAGLFLSTDLEKYALVKSVCEFYYKAFSGEYSIASFITARLFSDAVFIGIAFLLSFNKITVLFNGVFLFYRGFVLFSVSVVFIGLFGISGAFLYIFCVFLRGAIVGAAISLFSGVMLYALLSCKKRVAVIRKQLALIAVIMAFAAAIAESVMLFIVIRPLHLTF